MGLATRVVTSPATLAATHSRLQRGDLDPLAFKYVDAPASWAGTRPMKMVATGLIGDPQSLTASVRPVLPNGSRLSCGAKLKYSQMEFYHTAGRTFAGLIEAGRRQLQAPVRQQAVAIRPWSIWNRP